MFSGIRRLICADHNLLIGLLCRIKCLPPYRSLNTKQIRNIYVLADIKIVSHGSDALEKMCY